MTAEVHLHPVITGWKDKPRQQMIDYMARQMGRVFVVKRNESGRWSCLFVVPTPEYQELLRKAREQQDA